MNGSRRRHSRGQTTVEFIVLIGFMLFIFTAFFLVIQQRSMVLRQQLYVKDLQKTSNILLQEVILAQQVRFGYERSFTLPASVDGEPYVVTLSNSTEFSVRRNVNDDEYVVFLPTSVVFYNAGNGCYDTKGTLNAGQQYTIIKAMLQDQALQYHESIGLCLGTCFTSPPVPKLCT